MDNATSSGIDGEQITDWVLRGIALAGFLLACIVLFLRRCPVAAAAIYNVVCCRRGHRRIDVETIHQAADVIHEIAERAGTPISFLAVPPRLPPRRPSPAPPPPENDYAIPQDLVIPNVVVTTASSPASERVFTPIEPPPSPVPESSETEQDTTAPVLQALSAESFIHLATHDPPLSGRQKETPIRSPIALHIDDQSRWLRGSMRL